MPYTDTDWNPNHSNNLLAKLYLIYQEFFPSMLFPTEFMEDYELAHCQPFEIGKVKKQEQLGF